jgi:hypothetical protein
MFCLFCYVLPILPCSSYSATTFAMFYIPATSTVVYPDESKNTIGEICLAEYSLINSIFLFIVLLSAQGCTSCVARGDLFRQLLTIILERHCIRVRSSTAVLRSNTAWLGICAATPCPWSNSKTRRKDEDTKTAGSVGCQELENLHRAHRAHRASGLGGAAWCSRDSYVNHTRDGESLHSHHLERKFVSFLDNPSTCQAGFSLFQSQGYSTGTCNSKNEVFNRPDRLFLSRVQLYL